MRLFLAICFFLCAPLASQAADPIRFSSALPLDARQSMVTFALLEEAFERIGYPFEAEYHSARRSLISSNSGETDGELFRVYNFLEISNGAFPNLIRIDVELQRLELVLFTHKDSSIKTLDDLAGRSIAYVPDHKIMETTLGQRAGVRVVETPEIDNAFRLLAMGRIDGVGYGRVTGGHVISGHDGLAEKLKTVPITDVRLFGYINKQHKPLIAPLEAALRAMQEDGSFARIKAAANARYFDEISRETAVLAPVE